MRKIIQDNYEKRQQKLEAALKNAAPSVSPVIQSAIDQSDLEYQQALSNLQLNEDTQNLDDPGNAGGPNNLPSPQP